MTDDQGSSRPRKKFVGLCGLKEQKRNVRNTEETERQRDRETERQRDRETERQRDRETERQRDKQET
jgi:hypothetical protein